MIWVVTVKILVKIMGEIIWLDVLKMRTLGYPFNEDVLIMRTPGCPYY